MEYDNTNRGTLSKNTPKEGKEINPKAPQYKGKLNVNGHDYELSAWLRESQHGKFFSLSIQEPYKASQTLDAPQQEQQADDLPF